MKCPSCGFENMRNAERCARCAAQLVWDGEVRKEEFQPPRARRGKRLNARYKADRAMARLSRSGLPFSRYIHLLTIWRKLSREDYIGLILSIIPGAGCLYKKKYLTGAVLFLGWAACILAVFHTKSAYTVIPALILAAFLHFLAMVSAAEPARVSDARSEFWAFCFSVASFLLVCLVVVILLYLYRG